MDNMFNGGTIGVEQIQQMAYLLSNPQLLQNLELMSGISLGNSSIERTLPKRYAINQELEFTQEVDGKMKLIGKGSVYEIKGRNKWGVAYYFEDDNRDKKRKVKSDFENREEATKFLDALIETYEITGKVEVVGTGKACYDEIYLVENFLKYYMAKYKKKIASSTYTSYEVTCRNISRYIGEKYIQELTKDDIEELFIRMKKEEEKMGLRKTIDTYERLCEAIAKAYELKEIKENIVKALGVSHIKDLILTKKEQTERKVEIIADKNMKALKDSAKSELDKRIFEILEHTGMRAGELGALKWSLVDFEGEQIRIRGSLTRMKGNENKVKDVVRIGTRKVGIGTTKTPAGIRDINLNAIALEALLKQKQYIENNEKEREARKKEGTEELVFTNKGKPIKAEYIRNKIRAISEEQGLYQIDEDGNRYLPYTHMIRHLFCTRLIRTKQAEILIIKLMGHANTSTLQRYIDIEPEMKIEAVKGLEQFN